MLLMMHTTKMVRETRARQHFMRYRRRNHHISHRHLQHPTGTYSFETQQRHRIPNSIGNTSQSYATKLDFSFKRHCTIGTAKSFCRSTHCHPLPRAHPSTPEKKRRDFRAFPTVDSWRTSRTGPPRMKKRLTPHCNTYGRKRDHPN